MRNLETVIEQLVTCAPELEQHLAHVKMNIRFTAPEIMGDRWRECAAVLNGQGQDHPKADELRKIFAGHKRRSERIGARRIQTMNNTATSETQKPAPIRSTVGLGDSRRYVCEKCGSKCRTSKAKRGARKVCKICETPCELDDEQPKHHED